MSAAAALAPTRAAAMLAFAERSRPPQPQPTAPPHAAAGERCVDPQLWLACAGSMCTVPCVGAAVYYFPQGHAEQASAAVDLAPHAAPVPPCVPCRVVAVRLMADPHTDEVFAKLRLAPLRPGEPAVDGVGDDGQDQQQPKPTTFAKTLTQSDANNGGGFSVPRFCAETIFPELDYRADPPLQYVYARDVHGVEWKFRHIYRGTPRRHLLTTGWSNFVNQKKLQAGDSIVFLRDDAGQVHVGLRRARRGLCPGAGDDGGGSPGWDHPYRGPARGGGAAGRVPPEDVAAAARLAAAGQPFEVVHFPRASSPEFCVRAAAVRAAMQQEWCPGMRFKMAFETEDSSRISWFMGTVAGVQAADPARWPLSPWRLLQVTWDEPGLLPNVTRVCPWLVELVSSMPNLHLPPFSPPRKKPRIPPYAELPFERQLFDPSFPPGHHPLPLAPHPHPHHDPTHHASFVPFFPFPDGSAAAGIQGARHAQSAQPISDLHTSNLHQSLLFVGARSPPDHRAPPAPGINTDLTIGGSPSRHGAPRPGAAKADDVKVKPPGITLFGRVILTEAQIKGSSGAPASPGAKGKLRSGWDAEKAPISSDGSGSGVTQGSPTKHSFWVLQSPSDNGGQSSSESAVEPGQCKVFAESDEVGRTLDLSALGSFEQLFARLSDMFGTDRGAELRSHVLYRTAAGEVKHVGDEPFSAFVRSARRISILTDAGSASNTGS